MAAANETQGMGTGLFGSLFSTLLNHEGGVEGIVAKLKGGGLGETVQSWIAKGENLPVTAEQIKTVLGSEALGKLAATVGISDTSGIAAQIAKFLPEAIDKMSPDGTLPAKGGTNA